MLRRPALLVVLLCLSGEVLTRADLVAQTGRSTELPRVDDAASLLARAAELATAGRFVDGAALAETALSIREREVGAESPAIADALDTLGDIYLRTRDHARALPILERSLRLREAAQGEPPQRLARTLELLTTAQQVKGDYVASRATLERALRLRNGSTDPEALTTLNLLSLQDWFEGRLPESAAASREALALAERTRDPDDPARAEALSNLAFAVAYLGDVAQARSLQQQALAIMERRRGSMHYEIARYLNDLGDFDRMLGEYATARAEFEQALRITEAVASTQYSWLATYVHNLALVNATLGDFDSARRQQMRAIEIWTAALGPTHPFVAVALTELAAIYREQRQFASALPLLDRALTIRERRLGANHPDVARTLADQALTLSHLGQRERAQAAARRALQIWESSSEADAPDHATVLALYAELQMERGDAAAARPYFERALEIRRRAFGASHPSVADAQIGLANALARIGDRGPAFAAAVEAETIGRAHLRLMLRYLPQRESLNYAATRPRGLDLALALADTDADSRAAALDALVRGRALVLDEVAGRYQRTNDADGVGSLRQALLSAQQRLANVIVRGPADLGVEGYRALIDELRVQAEAAERALADRRVQLGLAQNDADVGLSDIEQALPAGTALVSFVRYEHPSTPPSSTTSRPSYAAFVVSADPGRTVAFVPLGAARTLDGLVQAWRAEARGASLTPAVTAGVAEQRYRTVAVRLRRAFWDPVAAHLGSATRVFVVPDGTLNLVSVAALPAADGTFIGESALQIHYLSAERDLTRGGMAPSAETLLALGGPAFDGGAAGTRVSTRRATAGDCGTIDTLRFSALPGTRVEATDISTLWSSSAGGSASLLTGAAATESALKRSVSHQRVVHLATHGFVLANCDPPRASTRGVGGIATAGPPRPPRIENPLLLSGLALAGANRRRSGDDDGILTAEEIAGLDLQGTEWAVLSACDTGLGEIRAGEGVLGLRRAFQIAGARTVIMSLWSVDDGATREWMRALYEARLQQHLDTPAAISVAMRTVLKQRRAAGKSTHPFYWAAFVAAGDWR